MNRKAHSFLMLLAMLQLCLTSCSTQGQSPLLVPSEPKLASVASLTNQTGSVLLVAPRSPDGVLSIMREGEMLVGKELPVAHEFRINDGELSAPGAVWRQKLVVLSNDWRHLALELAPTNDGPIRLIHRDIVVVEPDLIVMLDDVTLNGTPTVERAYSLPAAVKYDAVRGEWECQLSRGGVTARFFDSSSGRLKPDSEDASTVTLQSAPANGTPLRYISVFLVHEGMRKRSLAFKLLESESAIGVRIHRDGLPTLVAFRKSGHSSEASLTGLKFPGPVAVDVFRPRRK